LKKNFYLAIKESFNSRVIPVLWSSAKTYYEQYGNKADQWNWSDPWLSYDYTVDEILKICSSTPPDIFGFSIYVWNEGYMDELAKKIKDQHPNCLIVYGGPQIDIKYSNNFFQLKSWVDVVCPSDGYGEITIQNLLDCYPIQDFEEIPYIYYTNKNREKLLSQKTVEKKSFQWPTNIYQAQENSFGSKINQIEYAMVETTRGCPYKCIYCDWGGGTYTKVVSKPYTTILDEIEWVAKNKIPIIELASANFGILPIDLNIAEYLVDMSKKYNYPKLAYTENAKNSLGRVEAIKTIWAEAGLLNHYKVSIQTLNEDIKNNVQRIDPKIEKQVEVIKKLKSNFKNLPIKIETIIGLPGDTYKNNLDQIDTLFKFDLPMSRSNIWMLLPEAPAFDPVMREQFQIRTVKKMFLTSPWTIKDGFQADKGVHINMFPDNPNTESVVGTYSYTTSEFVDMFVINALAQAGDSTGINSHLIKYICSHYNLNPSFVIDLIYQHYIKTPANWKNNILGEQFNGIYKTIDDWVHGELKKIGFDYHEKFPLIMPIHMYVPFLILINLKDFYSEICDFLSKKLNDEKIIDLGIFLSNSIIDLSYNPKFGRKFSTKYNWLSYFDTDLLDTGHFEYKITDKTVYTNGQELSIDWHDISQDDMQVKKQFVYKQLGDITISKTSKTLQLVTSCKQHI
jgi:hypothetical protein